MGSCPMRRELPARMSKPRSKICEPTTEAGTNRSPPLSRAKFSAKSSMARNPLIEAIHAARYDLETCARHQRAACQKKLEELLRNAVSQAGSTVNPERLLDAL